MRREIAERPLGVSVCCLSFNHAPYIAAALDSFLCQEADFPIEVLVHDDCSTDGTIDILREYERRHPGVVRVVYEEHNRWDPVRTVPYVGGILVPLGRYRYVALCEGDDYWCDPHKLARQVAYLEAHPACSMVACQAIVEDATTGREIARKGYGDAPRDLDGAYLASHWGSEGALPTAGVVVHAQTEYDYAHEWDFGKPFGDYSFALFCAQRGVVHYDPTISCVYRLGTAGSFTDGNRRRVLDVRREIAGLLFYQNIDAHTGGAYHEALMARGATGARNIAVVAGWRRFFRSPLGSSWRPYLSIRDLVLGLASRLAYMAGLCPVYDPAQGRYRLRRMTAAERADGRQALELLDLSRRELRYG